MSLSTRSRDAALNAVLAVPAAPVTRTGAVMQVRHQLEHTEALTPNERALFSDWLDRVAR